MVGADHGIVDHLHHVRHGPASIQCLHDILPEPGQRPAPELPVDARPLAEFFRQVTPWSTRPSYPEDPIKNKPVVDRFACVRGVLGLPLRQTAGFVASLLKLSGLDWSVPDFSTLSRRQKTLDVVVSYCGSKGPLHLLVDSTGIKVEGEWHTAQAR